MISWTLVAFLLTTSSRSGSFGGAVLVSNDDGVQSTRPTTTTTEHRIPPSCKLVMAQSSIPGAGWGVFSLTDRRRGEAVMEGDVVVQVSDLNTTFAENMWRVTFDYAWDSQETGGQYEGVSVMSLIFGLGMLANGSPRDYNILPALEPMVDEAGVTRQASAGAGAFTHYHNYTFLFEKDIQAGDEIMANYGPNWFQKRADKMPDEVITTKPPNSEERKLQRPKPDLLQEGFCLDNLTPGLSTIPHAGRGAMANRNLQKGSIVAPVPVLPITKRQALDTTRVKQNGLDPRQTKIVTTRNLLLNYCYGHPNSSVLLLPYSPMVNLVNHSPKRANVRLQWSSSSSSTSANQGLAHETLSLEQLHQINTNRTSSTGGLMLELVALRDIHEGEEILMDYGPTWQLAWEKHLQQWTPPPSFSSYVPSHVFDEAIPVLATQDELQSTNAKTNGGGGYPTNVLTSCFYRYQNGKAEDQIMATSNNNKDVTTTQWNYTKGIYELRNLRPCTVMQRFQVATKSTDRTNKNDQEKKKSKHHDQRTDYYYTVVIRNRYGLAHAERIPTGHMHVVTKVPRRAIRFSDKIYTTDQHLEGAFRQEIGLADDIFSSQWMDGSDSTTVSDSV